MHAAAFYICGCRRGRSASWASVPACIDVALAYGASEEAFAAVAAGRAVVLPRGLVPTDGAVGGDPVWAGQAGLRRHAVCFTQKQLYR